jgi:Clostripain family
MSEEKYKWVVMIYLAGNNSLSEACVHSLTDMLNTQGTQNVAVFAQLNTGVHENTFLRMRPGMSARDLHEQLKGVLARRRDQQPGETRAYQDEVYDFVNNCIREVGERGAEHLMLIMSGHGSGAASGQFLRSDNKKALDVMNLDELLERINSKLLGGNKIDILGLDSCLMSMTEIAYAAHDQVKVMIGAEGYEPIAGWPYAKILACVDEAGDDVKLLARQIVGDYVDHYRVFQAANVSVDQAACDLSESVTLMEAIKRLSGRLGAWMKEFRERRTSESAFIRDAVVLAHWEAQLYGQEQYTDLYDFCSLLKSRLMNAPECYRPVVSACQNVLNTVLGAQQQRTIEGDGWDERLADEEADFRNASGFVIKSCYSGWAVQYSYGVSIYFPWAEISSELEQYAKLRFSQDSGWGEFLRVYLAATKRAPRNGASLGTLDFSSVHPNLLSAPVQDVAHHGFRVRDAWSNRDAEPNRNADPNRNGEPNKNADPNKDADPNRSLRSVIGSMRNPPTQFCECDCGNE